MWHASYHFRTIELPFLVLEWFCPRSLHDFLFMLQIFNQYQLVREAFHNNPSRKTPSLTSYISILFNSLWWLGLELQKLFGLLYYLPIYCLLLPLECELLEAGDFVCLIHCCVPKAERVTCSLVYSQHPVQCLANDRCSANAHEINILTFTHNIFKSCFHYALPFINFFNGNKQQ